MLPGCPRGDLAFEESSYKPGVACEIARDRRGLVGMILHLLWRFRPPEWQMHNIPWGVDLRQRCQGCAEHCHLATGITGLAQRAPQRILDGDNTWRTHRCGEVGHRGKRDRGKSSRFDLTLNQSNGPAADRSGRHQHNGVHLIFPQALDDGRHRLGQKHVRIEDIPHD